MRQVIEETERLGAMKTGVMSAFSETPASAVAPNGTLVLADGQPATPQTLALGDKAALHGQTAITSSPGGSSRGQTAGHVGTRCLCSLGRRGRAAARSQATAASSFGRASTGENRIAKFRQLIRVGTAAQTERASSGGMVFCGGRFEIGSTDGEVDMAFKLCQKRGGGCRRDVFERETPRHAVVVRDLFVDQYEVQNEQFVAFWEPKRDSNSTKKVCKGCQRNPDRSRW